MAEGQIALDPQLERIAEYSVEARKKFVGLLPEDLVRISAIKDVVQRHADEHAAAFFAHLSILPEGTGLLRRGDLLEEAKRRKREHLHAMVEGDYGRSYVEQRLKLGVLYSQVGLDARVFLGAFLILMKSIGEEVIEHFAKDPAAGFEHFMSLQKIAFFDIGIISDVLIAERERTITLQQEAIRELSTPTLQIRDRLLILPIIGVLDTNRAKQLTEGLLRAIRANRAKVVVMDVTGVATVDSKVADHLIRTMEAARLMGATVVLTGLSAEVAQSLVTLGIDLSKLNAVGDLQGGLEEAERMLGYGLVRLNEPAIHHTAG
jgi:rsbT co-antagonist protein RsbR